MANYLDVKFDDLKAESYLFPMEVFNILYKEK